MSVYVGFKISKASERKAYISEYYCGGCGWPVSDHDRYCPECGGAFRKEDATDRTCKMIPNGEDGICATLTCSECGNCESVYAVCADDFNFCPNCGAKVIANEQ